MLNLNILNFAVCVNFDLNFSNYCVFFFDEFNENNLPLVYHVGGEFVCLGTV